MKCKKALAGLLALCMLPALVGCGNKTVPPGETTAPVVTLSPADVGAIYTDAIAGLSDSKQILLSLEDTRTISLGNQSFTITDNGTAYHSTDAAGNAIAEISREIDYGMYNLQVEELYMEGCVFAHIGENLFSQQMTEADFLARCTPLIMVDAALYQGASVSTGGKTLKFYDATMPEAWANMPSGAQLLSASAIVTLDDAGSIASTLYEIQWQEGAVTVQRKVSAKASIPEVRALQAPSFGAGYKRTDDLEVVYQLEEAYGLMIQAPCVTSVAQETLVCQAAGIGRVAQKNIDHWKVGPELMIRTIQALTQTDYATGTVTTDKMDEIFNSGIYTYSTNGSEWQQNDEVNFGLMLNHYQSMLLNNIWDISTFSDVTVASENGMTLFTFACGEDFDAAMRADINSSLFDDETYLDVLASEYRSGENSYYIAIDNASGLITATGLSYSGYHTIGGTEYALIQQVNQSFDLASLSAYRNITGQPEAETEPAEKATPLFYKVTGSDGQTLWLLGTIHIGDEKTGYLPQQIMDAFHAADALAVEADILDAQERMQTDEELASALRAIYCYPDTATSDHVGDKALYEKAELLMKASGNFSASAQLMKPSVWSGMLEQFYLRQGYSLTAEKGADMRLLTLAKEEGKQIIEIESVLSQARILYGWSEALQEYLLLETANTTIADYNAAAAELYRLWCEGDAQKLTDYIRSENAKPEGMRSALYEEYTNGMLTQRNAQMLEAAKSCLESGQTVFYAVGLAHLLTEDGLVDMLKAEGYTVEQVSF